MAINSVSYGPTYLSQSMLNLNNQLATLTSQLTTGKKSTSYAGMGVNEGFAIAARAQLANISAFSDTMSNITTNIGIANTELQAMVDIGTTVLNSANSSMQGLNSAGQTIAQQTATSQLSSMVGILNMQAGDRFLFSGSAINTPSVASADDILNGTTTQAGLKQVISERQQADGTTGLGRLVITSPAATSVQVAEDVAGSPFGLKLSAVSSSLTGATVTGPAGSPAAVSIDVGAINPNNGDKVSFAFTLPDGTTESIQLTASSATPPPVGSFAIGANSTVKHEVSNNLIRRMDLIVVDDLAAAKADSGDLVEACQTRIARWEDIVPLEKFVAEGVPQPRPKRMFFQSNGIADEDLAVGKYALDQAKRKKLKLRSVTEI